MDTRFTESSVCERPRRRSALTRFGLLAGILLLCPRARADVDGVKQVASRRECVAAAEATQTLRDQGRFREARERSLVCSRAECPSALRRDCSVWLLQIEESTPTAVFRAVDSNGKDLIEVRVDMDGRPLLTAIEGRAIPVDPGPHRFSFASAGYSPAAEEVVIAQGEKNRRILVRLAARDVPVAPAAPIEPPRAYGPSGRGVAFWTAATTGVAGVAGMTVFGLSALSKSRELSSSCAPEHACTQEDHDALRSRALIADVSAGVLVVSAAVLLWLGLRGSASPATSSRAPVVSAWSVRF